MLTINYYLIKKRTIKMFLCSRIQITAMSNNKQIHFTGLIFFILF